jgi:hypothetical protein
VRRTFARDGPDAQRQWLIAAIQGGARLFRENGIAGLISLCVRGKSPATPFARSAIVKPDEIVKLEAYFKRIFNDSMVIKARPRKDDSAEVYLGDEFLGIVFRDDEDGDLSYNFSMAILDVDLT